MFVKNNLTKEQNSTTSYLLTIHFKLTPHQIGSCKYAPTSI